MRNTIERLTASIKQQAEAFLNAAGEFYPFGSYINKANHIIPLAAYVEDENDNPPSLPLIDMLENYTKEMIGNGQCVMGVIAVNVLLKEGGQTFDAVQIRFFEKDNEFTHAVKYNKQGESVIFL